MTPEEIGNRVLDNFRPTWEANRKKGLSLRLEIRAIRAADPSAKPWQARSRLRRKDKPTLRRVQQIFREDMEEKAKSRGDFVKDHGTVKHMNKPIDLLEGFRDPPERPTPRRRVPSRAREPVDRFKDYRDPEVKVHDLLEPEAT